MTTIVRHRRTGNEYILLGINGDTNKTNPSRFISELFTQDKADVSYSATVCDAQGNLFLAYIDDLVVVEIDGQKPGDILPESDFTAVNPEVYTSAKQNSPEFDNEFDDEEFDDEELDDSFDPTTKSTDFTQTVNVVPPEPEIKKGDGEDEEDWI